MKNGDNVDKPYNLDRIVVIYGKNDLEKDSFRVLIAKFDQIITKGKYLQIISKDLLDIRCRNHVDRAK